MAGEFASLK